MAGAHGLPLRHALALGLLQGPTELLPVSSSSHTTLVPWLAGWPYCELDPRLRKSFEVSLHAGTAAALLLRAPWDKLDGLPGGRRTGTAAHTGSASAKLVCVAAAALAPALVGYTLGRQIEHRLGTPATIAAGLLAGSTAMIAGEYRARSTCAHDRRDGSTVEYANSMDPKPRRPTNAGMRDGLALGLALGIAQALALIPGVSRSGATFATGRARGLSRREADRLSWQVGLPVIAGATGLQGTRLAREGVSREMGPALAVGAASAFASTLASTTVLGPRRRAALLPACTVYRAALALVVVRRTRNSTNRHAPQIQKK
jgi:undecaprenyl-diphosphatase